MSYQMESDVCTNQHSTFPRERAEDEVIEEPYLAHTAITNIQNREPRRRRRIPRACELCRRRKIKCDGGEICAGCVSVSSDCIYQDPGTKKAVQDHIHKLDLRLQNMEGMFTQILGRLDSHDPRGAPRSVGISQGMHNFHPSPPQSDGTSILTSNEATSCNRRPSSVGPWAVVASPVAFGSTTEREDQSHQFNEQIQNLNDTPQGSKRRKYNENRSLPPPFADAYGELHVDEWGQSRYVGIGSTISVMDICIPFRERINFGLEKKGFSAHNTFLGLPSCTLDTLARRNYVSAILAYGELPPRPLVETLLDCFYERLYFIVPVISQHDFRIQLGRLTTMPDEATNSDFLPVIYSVFAVAALVISHDKSNPGHEAMSYYAGVDMGTIFFDLSNQQRSRPTSQVSQGFYQPCPQRCLNAIITLVLQATYLSAMGSQAEAWIATGQASRLGQDLGLHRSAIQLGLPKADQERRRYVWWCIYSLDRTLSAALGRPLAIRDADCDIELPSNDNQSESYDCTGFVSILNLRGIIGAILSLVASVRTVKAGRHISKNQEMQTLVAGLNSELQAWATEEVPANMKGAAEGNLNVEKLIALSGYFSALILLYRFFMRNPHRPSPLKGSEAVFQCARAATNCIRITTNIFASLPICPDLIFHAQHVFTSSVVLLHCIRRSEDATFIQIALQDVELAVNSLRQLQNFWAGARKLTAIIEEYVEFTLECLQKNPNSPSPNPCSFQHGNNELTGLELRDGSKGFPSDWTQLDHRRLPGPTRRSVHVPSFRAGSNTKVYTGERSIPLKPQQAACNEIFTSNHAGRSISMNHQTTYTVPSVSPNLYRRTQSQQRHEEIHSGDAIPMANEKDQVFHGGDPTRSWGIGATDDSFDLILNTGINSIGEQSCDYYSNLDYSFWGSD